MSSSYYGVIFPEFWTGPTGSALQRQGGKDAQLAALYLMSSRHSTMIGLYALSLRDFQHEIGFGGKSLARALAALAAVGFADYDAATEHVWVREMAKFRLGLQRGALKADDNRVTGAQRLFDRLADNPFLEPFFDRYAKDLRLRRRRTCGLPVTPLLDVAPSKGLGRGLGGASKPGTEISTDRDQGSERSGIRDQNVQTYRRVRVGPRSLWKTPMRSPTHRPPIPFRQLCALARTLIETEPTIDTLEWSERIKDGLLRLEFTYPEDPAAIHQAMAQVTRALERLWGPRPTPESHEPRAPRPPAHRDAPWPRAEGLGPTSLASLVQALRGSPGSATSSAASPRSPDAMPTPLPPPNKFQKGMQERLAAILATSSKSERQRLEEELARYIQAHAEGRLVRKGERR